MKVYTRTGDDGTTGLLFGGRIAKDSAVIDANGAIDEAQAALGVVRAHAERGSELDGILVELERELYVLMAEMATAPANRSKLTPGVTAVTEEMVGRLEMLIDELTGRFPPLRDFVIPGHDHVSAGLDVARTTVRRAEREAIRAAPASPLIVRYLNRLSDLVWTMARWQEAGDSLLSRRAGGTGTRSGRAGGTGSRSGQVGGTETRAAGRGGRGRGAGADPGPEEGAS